MNVALLLVIIVAVLLLSIIAYVGTRKVIILRWIAGVMSFGAACFCGFGFLSSYEIPSAVKRLPWQIGYGVIGLAFVVVFAVSVFSRRTTSSMRS